MPLLNSGQLLRQPEFKAILDSLRGPALPPLPMVTAAMNDAYRTHTRARDNPFERLAGEVADNAELSLDGDAFLGLQLTRILREDERLRTGTVTFIKGALVANKTLARLAVVYGLHLGLDANASARMQANTFEAYLGALCRSAGDAVAARWIDLLFRPIVQDVVALERNALYAPSLLTAGRARAIRPEFPQLARQGAQDCDWAHDPPLLVGGRTGKERLEEIKTQQGITTQVFLWVFECPQSTPTAPLFRGMLMVKGAEEGRRVQSHDRTLVQNQLAHNAVEMLHTEVGQLRVHGRRVFYGRGPSVASGDAPNPSSSSGRNRLRGSARGCGRDEPRRKTTASAHPYHSCQMSAAADALRARIDSRSHPP